MINIETPRLAIRNFCETDVEGLLDTILTYHASGYAVYDFPWPATLTEIQGVVQWFSSGDKYVAVCLKESGQFIGFIALNRDDDPREVVYDLGYVFHARYQGQGYATEGCRALIDYAFNTLGANRITSGTAVANRPSCNLLTRLGFHITGQGQAAFQKDAQGNPITFDGYAFTLTREAWEQAKVR